MSKIYVGNLPYRASEQTISDLFGKFGPIEEVALIKDRETGRPKGFGFITFKTDSAAQSALALNGQDFQGRPLKVSLAKDRPPRTGGSGGGRGGDGEGKGRW
jgi:cold-inducible RNA-binding protein